MAGKNSGVKLERVGFFATIRGLIAIIVLGISTLFFATLMIFVYIFSPDWCARTISQIWAMTCMVAGGIRVNVHGVEKLDKRSRYVFMSNHQSLVDIPILLSVLPFRISFMAKPSLFMIPFFGWGLWVAGHVRINRTNPRKARESILKAAESLKKKGRCLLIFPEGTRSPDGVAGEFKRGSFALPIESGAEVVPVAIHNACNILPKRSFICRSGNVDVFIGDPIPAAGMKSVDKPVLAAQVRGQIVAMLEQVST